MIESNNRIYCRVFIRVYLLRLETKLIYNTVYLIRLIPKNDFHDDNERLILNHYLHPRHMATEFQY